MKEIKIFLALLFVILRTGSSVKSESCKMKSRKYMRHYGFGLVHVLATKESGLETSHSM
jgi:hypothetical protein